MSKSRSTRNLRNDQRSNAKNPNNATQKAAMDNRSSQLNPKSPAYHSSRGGKSGRAKG